MGKAQKIGLFFYLLFFSVSCSTFSKLDTSRFKNSTLSNLNPAPEKMGPPKKTSEADLVDPVYLRTQADYHYTLGEALSLEGDSQKAIEEFKLTLVYDPQSVAVRLRLATEFVKQGLVSEAVEQAEAAVELDPSSFDGRLLLGGLYSSLRMYDVAMKQYEFLKIQFPENLEVPIYMGALLAEQGKYDEAETTFMNLAKAPDNDNPSKAYYYMGRIRVEQASDTEDKKSLYKKAEKAYVKSLSLAPKSEEVVLALAKLYDKMDQPERGLKALASFQEKFGPKREVANVLSIKYLEKENYDKAFEQLQYIEGFEPENLNVKVKMALILIEEKKYDDAIVLLEEIIRVAPTSDKIRFYLGAVYEEIKKPRKAIEHFLTIKPTSLYFSEAIVHSSYLYKGMGDYPRAIAIIKKGIEEKDDIPQFYAFYASLLDDRKRHKEALDMLKVATKKFPEHTQLLFFLGSMHDRLGNTSETIASMKKVIAIDENYVQALNYLAYTYSERDTNLDEAEELAMRALSLSPEDPYILDTMGWIMYKKGDLQEAVKYLEAAYNTNSKESIIAEHLGDAYFRLELIEKAKKMYLKAVSIAENKERIRELKTKLSAIQKQKDLRRPASSRAKKQSKNP